MFACCIFRQHKIFVLIIIQEEIHPFYNICLPFYNYAHKYFYCRFDKSLWCYYYFPTFYFCIVLCIVILIFNKTISYIFLRFWGCILCVNDSYILYDSICKSKIPCLIIVVVLLGILKIGIECHHCHEILPPSNYTQIYRSLYICKTMSQALCVSKCQPSASM